VRLDFLSVRPGLCRRPTTVVKVGRRMVVIPGRYRWASEQVNAVNRYEVSGRDRSDEALMSYLG